MLVHEMTHQYVVNEMLIRSLERDLKVLELEKLKTGLAIAALYEKTLYQVRSEHVKLKKRMERVNLRFQSENRIDEYFTSFMFTFNNAPAEVRYANYALRNHMIKELTDRLQIEKPTT